MLVENQNGMSSVAHSGRSVARCGAFEFRPMLYFGKLHQIQSYFEKDCKWYLQCSVEMTFSKLPSLVLMASLFRRKHIA